MFQENIIETIKTHIVLNVTHQLMYFQYSNMLV